MAYAYDTRAGTAFGCAVMVYCDLAWWSELYSMLR